MHRCGQYAASVHFILIFGNISGGNGIDCYVRFVYNKKGFSASETGEARSMSVRTFCCAVRRGAEFRV